MSSDFMPTHWWHLTLGSAGSDETPVQVLETHPTFASAFLRVRTSGGSTYLARIDELTPIKEQS